MNEVIRTTDLSKHYGKLHAVDGISLTVHQGEIYGFLGLNGAGKTTTIRMLLGMIKPTGGAAYLNGKKIEPNNYEIWQDVGYIVETPYSYPELTVKENLEIIRRLRSIKDKDSIDTIIDQLQLGSYTNVKAKHLSLGNAQRLGLAKALLHKPSILILDEPSNGLDPAGIVEVRELLQDLARNHGTTIFISSHILEEISKLATRISIIDKGKLIQELDSEHLKALQQKRLIIKCTNNKAAALELTNAGYRIDLEGDSIISKDTRALSHPEKLAQLLVQAGCPPMELKTDAEDLETYFLRVIHGTGGNSK